MFSPDRICKENKGFSLKIIGDISCLLNKSLNQVEEEYGKHDVAVASGPYGPGYITEDGYLICFYLDINDIVGLVRKIDLLTGETVEKVSVNGDIVVLSEEIGAFALAGATYTEVKMIKRGTC